MAFPQVAAVSEDIQDTVVGTHDIDLPIGVSAGDLLVAFFVARGGVTHTWPITWTLFAIVDTGNANLTATVGYRIATGDVNDALSIDTSVNARSAAQVYRITGHDATSPPEIPNYSEATTANPDPPSLAPVGGAKDYLWFAVACWQNAGTVSSYPTDYANGEETLVAAGTGSVSLAVARRELNAASEDPGTFTISGSLPTLAVTMAVHPEAGESPFLIMQRTVLDYID